MGKRRWLLTIYSSYEVSLQGPMYDTIGRPNSSCGWRIPLVVRSLRLSVMPWNLLLTVALATLIPCTAFGQSYNIKTIAGIGLPVNILATAAGLSSIQDAAVDSSGNLFITPVQYDVVLRRDAST